MLKEYTPETRRDRRGGRFAGVLAAVTALGLTAGTALVAHAVPITLTSTAGGNPAIMSGGSSGNYSFTHVLSGFDAATDTLTSASMTFTFTDDNDGSSETVKATIAGNGTTPVFTVASGSAPWTSAPISLGNLSELSDGAIEVVIQRVSGDLYFTGSTLTALGDRTGSSGPTTTTTTTSLTSTDSTGGTGGTQPIVHNPEPASVLLMGLGLAGLGLWGRKRFQAQKPR